MTRPPSWEVVAVVTDSLGLFGSTMNSGVDRAAHYELISVVP